MMESQFLTFLVAITLLTMTPGADTVMVTRNAIRGGTRDGVLTSFGIVTGLFLHGAISTGGLSLLLLGSATLFQVVKLAGAGYLIWLGAQNLWSAMRGKDLGKAGDTGLSRVSSMRSLREGLLSSTLNPKLAVFYLAFLPQFMDPAGNIIQQAMVLTSVHVCITLVWLGSLSVMINRARLLLQAPHVAKIMDGLTGTVLVAFGLRLALEEQG